ncbi:unnamed protein product [Cochlearia groenlandica]
MPHPSMHLVRFKDYKTWSARFARKGKVLTEKDGLRGNHEEGKVDEWKGRLVWSQPKVTISPYRGTLGAR